METEKGGEFPIISAAIRSNHFKDRRNHFRCLCWCICTAWLSNDPYTLSVFTARQHGMWIPIVRAELAKLLKCYWFAAQISVVMSSCDQWFSKMPRKIIAFQDVRFLQKWGKVRRNSQNTSESATSPRQNNSPCWLCSGMLKGTRSTREIFESTSHKVLGNCCFIV